MALHGIQNGDARAIVEAIANQHPYNPVEEWIRSRGWDGIDRLPAYYATLRTVPDYPTSLKESIMYCWVLSAVAAAIVPGFATRLVLTLQGPQSVGKTRWCMSHVPDPLLRAGVLKTDHHFDGANKDSLITAIRYWIVELGELESSFRKDQERLKGILTRDRDVVRLPYAAADAEFPRRTVFMASANGADFLSDPSGSTRWGVIAVESIDYEHGISMQQLFAQLAEAVDRGDQWWFTAEQEAELEAWNERHQTTSVVRDSITSVIDFDQQDVGTMVRVTATDLLRLADIVNPTMTQARVCGALLRKVFGPPKKSGGIYRWTIPLRRQVPQDNVPDGLKQVRDKFD
nr:virulence-associated E family protein [Sphingomonas sp. CFBP 13720]